MVEALERRALTDDHNIAQLLRQFVLLLLVGSVDLFADLDIKVISGHACCRGCDTLEGAPKTPRSTAITKDIKR